MLLFKRVLVGALNLQQEPGGDVKILSDRMMGIKRFC